MRRAALLMLVLLAGVGLALPSPAAAAYNYQQVTDQVVISGNFNGWMVQAVSFDVTVSWVMSGGSTGSMTVYAGDFDYVPVATTSITLAYPGVWYLGADTQFERLQARSDNPQAPTATPTVLVVVTATPTPLPATPTPVASAGVYDEQMRDMAVLSWGTQVLFSAFGCGLLVFLLFRTRR
jgi:hypothetical protein